MAIVQITKIQHRGGTRDNLPESLSDREIGISVDSGEIFVGAPNLNKIQYRRPGNATPEGIYPYSNIKILTEFDMSYTLTDKIYHNGPLLSGVATNSVELTNTFFYTDTLPLLPGTVYVKFENVFSNDQSGAKIKEISVKRLGDPSFNIFDSSFAYIDGRDVILNVVDANLTDLASTDEFQLTYFEANYLYEFLLGDTDAMIIDYSASAEDAWPSVGYTPKKPRRVGTLKIVADPDGVAVKDDYVELNPVPDSMPLFFSGRIEGSPGNEKVVITTVNTSAQKINITLNGRRWKSIV